MKLYKEMQDKYLEMLLSVAKALQSPEALESKNFPDYFNFVCHHCGATAREVGERSGYTKGTISRWSNGLITPPLEVRKKVMRILLSIILEQIPA